MSLKKTIRKLIFFMNIFSFDCISTLLCASYFMAVAPLQCAEDV